MTDERDRPGPQFTRLAVGACAQRALEVQEAHAIRSAHDQAGRGCDLPKLGVRAAAHARIDDRGRDGSACGSPKLGRHALGADREQRQVGRLGQFGE
jgi:hypothetical protein